jgi:tetratricopeptide (TPR) repeat protein
MADEQPEIPEREEPAPDANPLISQEELDRAIQAAQEAARHSREETKPEREAAPVSPTEPPAAFTALPPDRGILDQDELDQTIRNHVEAGKAGVTSSPVDDDIETIPPLAAEAIDQAEVVGQDEIDRMLRAIQDSDTLNRVPDAGEPLGEAVPDLVQPEVNRDSGQTTITQDELDSAVQAHAGGRKPGIDPASAVAGEPASDEESVDQDEIDRLLQAVQERNAAAAGEQPPLDSSEYISKDEIDKVLLANGASGAENLPPPQDTDEYGQMDQDAIDRLIREAAGQAAAEISKSDVAFPEADSREELGEAETSPPQAQEIEAEDARSQETTEGQEAASETFKQDDIDTLLAAVSGEKGADSRSPALNDTSSSSGDTSETEAPADRPPQAESEEVGGEQVNSSELDELLNAFSAEETLSDRELDEPLAGATADDDSIGTEVDAVPSREAGIPNATEAPSVEEVGAEEGVLEDEDPVARANRGAAESEVGSENLAAAVPEEDQLIDAIIAASDSKPPEVPSEDLAVPSSEELGAANAHGKLSTAPVNRDGDMVVQLEDEEIADMELQAAPSAEKSGAGAEGRKDFRRSLIRDFKKRLASRRPSDSLKTWSSLAAGVLCAIGTFLYLQSNQHRLPDFGLLSAPEYSDLSAVVRSARQLIDMGEYEEAEQLLRPVVGNARPETNLAEAQYLYIESRYRQLPSHISDQEAETLHREIDELVGLAPTFHGNPDLLRWKAGLYERSGALVAALDTYKNLTVEYLDQNNGDETLIQAARLAGKMKRPEESETFLFSLLQRFPASPHAPEAKLLLGDAQRDAGNVENARDLYVQVARSHDFSPIGAEATARLAQLELDRGEYAQAIRNLEQRLETATTVEGNDAIYLLLAKAYRGNGDPAKAETILRELISFFPESPHTAAAFVELSQTLDAIGNRREALRIASQASQRFSGNPAVLINEGDLQQREGNDGEAAKMYLEAVDAGSGSPTTLLAAGNAFARVNELAKAHRTLDRLLTDFPTSPEAFDGSIALAQVLQKQGQAKAALERLMNLADASAGRPQQIALRLALGDLYGDLGFRERASDQYRNAAAVTNDEIVLAKSAAALIDAGDVGSGMAIARRVDATSLPPDLAYEFLTSFANALLRMDTSMALETMEQAYNAYPGQRTEEGDRALLNAYLVTGQTARARALVMDFAVQTRANPGNGPRLQRIAIQWADALYARSDYTAAAEGYALAAQANPEGDDAAWAQFQQANALMNLGEFAQSLELLDAVADSSAPFAEDAQLKAEYARLEQRLRGTRPTAQAGG